MIERQFVAQKIKEYQIQEYIRNTLKRVGHSHTKLQKTPLGEKIIIHALRPGLVVGKKGQNIKKLTNTLKRKFNLENPQIEIAEVEAPYHDAHIVSERIAESLEKFGSARFKGISHKAMEDTMKNGALGIEILISGKVPSARAKQWRFYTGYLKKSGDIAQIGVNKAYAEAQLKTGTIGIQVRIMPPDIELPDDIEVVEDATTEVHEISAQQNEASGEKIEADAEKSEEEPAEKTAKTRKKAPRKKKAAESGNESKDEAKDESTGSG
ncbi:MAG: 30S ribosomal protein S3P, small subunit ribosomal protein S3 [archaeon GW2011_AR3]|nr:30S ribosomal protein S3P, small subunit ribosomal protein S3 [uncultured archaeon]KHO46804.1 MAG: 30S ribosomal protein S3P, small subunit ribosomal protein S3 [archaeon GW2011_AR3]MBS3109341.1 30S ribosomal protein S3 [Candidatus Woesearchaeota archaeon]